MTGSNKFDETSWLLSQLSQLPAIAQITQLSQTLCFIK